ncbi:hypothetical protein L248_1656 [Schleiferilactobacillus shenzhenensis LY-73]|uniref:DUF771 domain-containing protein n=1 Tax=Schleiferilactobacillus shenzhenensis LY-73 TaxID=1231336 RepID=U4TIK1_9LACO|nr:hypothetical protein L248_1656 [Schleiferilactobacillus shenzhenensis LY-73]
MPADQVIISREEYDRLVKLADTRQWWTMPDLVARYHMDAQWFANTIFKTERFRKLLRGQCVMYPREGVKGYTCEPVAFGDFMEKYFPEIARQAMKGSK